MGSLVLGGFDVVGDEDDSYSMGAEAAAGRRAPVRVPTPKWMNATTSQGVSRPEEEMDFLPFEALILTGATALTGAIISFPQRPMRGERIILGAVDLDDGSDVSHLAVIDPAIYVGAVQVGGAQGSTPFSTFAANAFGVRLSFPPMGQGTKVSIYSRLLVNASTAGIALTATVIGRAMR